MISLSAIVALAFVAFIAGFVDAIAGGGGMITVPALLTVGLPVHVTLGTNKGQAVFGAVASFVSFWKRGGIDRDRAVLAFACGLVGALAGALLQLAVPPKPLRPIVLVLLGFAALLLLLKPLFAKDRKAREVNRVTLAIVAFAIGAYDGFFGPGTGSLLIIAFVVLFGDTMVRASGNAKVVNLASNLASVVLFAIRGTVVWRVALPMAVCNALGAWVGAHVALRRGDGFVRVMVFAVVVALIGKLAYELAWG